MNITVTTGNGGENSKRREHYMIRKRLNMQPPLSSSILLGMKFVREVEELKTMKSLYGMWRSLDFTLNVIRDYSKNFNRENYMIRFAFQKENWQRKASCLPNMVKMLVSAVRIWVLVNKLHFLHCIHWIYCEQELNFYYSKPLKSGNLPVIVASTTFLKHTGSLNMGDIAAKF